MQSNYDSDPGRYFTEAGIPDKIRYEGPNSKNLFAFKYYNPEEVILGKKMKDWLRFSVNCSFLSLLNLSLNCSIF
jgi:xylose isomerase